MTRQPHLGDLLVNVGEYLPLDSEREAIDLLDRLKIDGKRGSKYKTSDGTKFIWLVVLEYVP